MFATTTISIRLVIGASGGPRIITSTAWVAMQHLLLNKNIKEAIDEPRLHHQLLPMKLYHEKLMSKVRYSIVSFFFKYQFSSNAKYSYSKPLQGIVEYLKQMGHNMSQIDPYFDHTGYYGGRVQAIATNEYNILTANNDRRKSGSNDGF